MSRVLSTALPNNTETVNEYDNDNRLARMATTSAKDGVLASFTYTYDGVGNKLTMSEEDGGVTSYQYDAAYRLVHVDYPQRNIQLITAKNNGTTQGKGKKNGHKKAEEPLPTSVSYAYDAAGNRISEIADNKTIAYHYNAANQLLQMGDTRYSYDANGNRIGKQDQEGLSRYRYNQDNFLAGLDDPEGKTTDYGYDAMNRRIYKAAAEKDITSFLYDGLEVLQEISGENSQKIVAYYRANGRIVTRQEYNVSQGNDSYQHRPEGRELFYAYDGLGSVVALSNHQGKEKTRYHYDAFGKVIDGDLTENRYTFTGRQLDPESGLYHFHFRQYDAQAGVWTTPDPIGVLGGVNLYGYVQNNPINFSDWLGLCKSQPTVGIKGTFIGLGGERPILGSPGTPISEGSTLGLALEGMPFGHNFAAIHDSMMSSFGYTNQAESFGFLGWTFVNFPAMPVAFVASVISTPIAALLGFFEDPTISKSAPDPSKFGQPSYDPVHDALDGISRMDGTRDNLGEATVGRVDADQHSKDEGGASTDGGGASIGGSDSGGSSTGGGPGQGGTSGQGHSQGGEGNY